MYHYVLISKLIYVCILFPQNNLTLQAKFMLFIWEIVHSHEESHGEGGESPRRRGKPSILEKGFR